MRPLHLIVLCLTATIGGVFAVLFADTLTISARGGVGSLAFAAFAAGVIGGAAGLALGGITALLDGIERWRGWRAGRLLVGVGALLFAAGMFPAHRILAKHILGAWLSTAYAVGAALLVGGLLHRLWNAERWWIGRLAAGVGAVGVVVTHWVNTHLFAGLYPELHAALSGASVAVAGLAIALLVRRRPLVQYGLLAIAAVGTLGGYLAYDATPTRSGAFFHGTEVAHAFDVLGVFTDGDRDGVPRPGVGPDCDDADPSVHPLRYEIAGNGKDDNCRLGDAPLDGQGPARTAPLSPKVMAWRAAHPSANVLLLFIDTLRADHVTAELTPTLWALRQRGVAFTQARTTVPRTPHAWTSLVTARFPSRVLRCRSKLERIGHASLVPRVRAHGLHTIGRLVGKDFVKRKLVRSFDEVRARGHVSQSTGAKVTRDVLALVKKAPRRFFAVAHYADPHAPYKAPGSFAVEGSLQARYAAEVRFTDHQIGLLLEGLKRQGRLDDTLIIAMADHGENLGDHGDLGGHHGVSVYDEVLHVPLIVAGPGIAPAQIGDPVSIVDITPTILQLIGARAIKGADGRSLAGYLLGDPPPPTYTISEFYDFGRRLRAVVRGRYKLIDDLRHGVRQLFDVEADPKELIDRSVDAQAEADALQAVLDGWIEYVADPEERAPQKCTGL